MNITHTVIICYVYNYARQIQIFNNVHCYFVKTIYFFL